jgi:hypothetical protein
MDSSELTTFVAHRNSPTYPKLSFCHFKLGKISDQNCDCLKYLIFRVTIIRTLFTPFYYSNIR